MKKFKFRLQVVLNMRENELNLRQMEMAEILVALKKQEETLQNIIQKQIENNNEMETLYTQDMINIQQIESHREFGIKLTVDKGNQERVIKNTNFILQMKQKEVQEAHKKVEILKKLKEKQEEQYYKEFLNAEIKEIDDITSARYKRNDTISY